MSNWMRSCAVIVLVLICFGCSGGGDSSTSVPSGVSGQGTASPAGGTITVTDPTSPIVGATVTVPPGAIASGNVHISITHQDNAPGPLLPESVAAGAIVVSKTIVLTKDRPGTFDQPITITVPYESSKLDPEDVPSVLYWDESTSRYSAVTVTDFDQASGKVTFQTSHFSLFQAAAIKGLGQQVRLSLIQTTVDTNFRPSPDGFSRGNFTSYSAPGANCMGMSSYSDWFFERAKDRLNGGKGLFQEYSVNVPAEDTIAQELIVRAHAAASQGWANILFVDKFLLGQFKTGTSLIQNMKLTMQPQIFLLLGRLPGATKWAHALVSYAYSSGKFSLYDPNHPGDPTIGVFFDQTGFTGFTQNGLFQSEPEGFAYDSVSSIYSPQDMQDLFDGAKTKWPEGEYGKITVTSLNIDSATGKATVLSPNNVHLIGTLKPGDGVKGYEPDHMKVYISGSLRGTFLLSSNSFDIPLPKLNTSTSNEILMVACKSDLKGLVGTNSCSMYGTFKRFEIVVMPCPATPTLVKDIIPGGSSSFVQGLGNSLVNVNGTLFFRVNDGAHGIELWKSDGTEAGTVMVKDIGPGNNTANHLIPQFLTNVNGRLFFIMDDGAHGLELWKSDGTEAGTVLVKDINPGLGSGFYFGLTDKFMVVGDTLYFTANDGVHGVELWKSNGTEAGTVLVQDILAGSATSSPEWLTNVNGTLYFTANDGVHGIELWKSGVEGTALIDIVPDAGFMPLTNLVSSGGTLFFHGWSGELWSSNGTLNGTSLVKKYNPGSSLYPAELTDVNGTLYFLSSDLNAGVILGLYKVNGTSAGGTPAEPVLVKGGLFNAKGLTKVGNRLFFGANDLFGFSRLWKSDETGTVALIPGGNLSLSNNGTPIIADVNGKAFFQGGALVNGFLELDLWKSDGTVAGTVPLKDIYPGSSSIPFDLTNVNGALFFVANSAATGYELWSVCGVP